MTETYRPTRRTLLLQLSWGTVTLMVNPVPFLARMAEAAEGAPAGAGAGPNGWSGAPGAARYRIDGLAKVLGEKIYARDFRARDMNGWPQRERMALVVRANTADQPFLGLDLSVLPQELQPDLVVDAERLAADSVSDLYPDTSPAGRPAGMLVAKGNVPAYFGQPLALLLFRDAATYRRAYRILQFNPAVVRYGGRVGKFPVATPYSPPTYLTRYVDDTGTEKFSQVQNGVTNPYSTQTPADVEAAAWRKRIVEDFTASGWKEYKSACTTQVLDPMFMEPEAGLGWYDRSNPGSPTLRLVLGTQATNGDVSDALNSLFSQPQCPYQVKAVDLISCYPGGGFGGRDVSPFAPLVMIAAVYSDGPVRLANDRFAQFQSGLKQLGASIFQSLLVDAGGKFQAINTNQVLVAGGKNNYSQWVAELAGYCAGGGYVIPRVIVDAIAQPTDGVVAGSMRGFGGPQAAFALETLIDEIAADLGRDAIDLRRQNALKEGDRTVTGTPLTEPMRIVEILDRARQSPLWTGREAEKKRRSAGGRLYGVGFALANQAYGTGGDGVMAAVALSPEGALTVSTNCVDMGNGSATTLALSTAAALGANAAAVRMGEVTMFGALKLSSSPPGAASPATLAAQRLGVAVLHGKMERLVERVAPHSAAAAAALWNNPFYTKSFAMSSSACLTAFHQVHAVEQASAVLFRTAVWPAAAAIWGIDAGGDGWKQARWVDGKLVTLNRPPLALGLIAASLHDGGGIAATMVHAFYAGAWVNAAYQVGEVRDRWAIDGLSTRKAKATDWEFHPRSETVPPPPGSQNYGRSLYAPSGTLAAVEVESASGKVSLVHLRTILDAGTVRQADLLSGQFQGGTAMGVGSALLEELPLGRGGAGDGDWNLNRYHVALASDLPLDRIELELLPPTAAGAPGKGIAEAVLCPVAPAIANAVAHATGRRFRSLPITPAKVLEALNQGGPQDAGR